MKKFLKIFFYNILIIAFLFILAEGVIYFYIVKQVKSDTGFDLPIFPKYHLNYYDWNSHYLSLEKEGMRKPFGLQYKQNKPIVIFGGSYAFGHRLKDEETFGFKLSEYLKCPVYTRAIDGWGIQHMLFQLREDENFYKHIPEPEYVIFLYIEPHVPRLYYRKFDWISSEYLSYVEKNNDLERYKSFYSFMFNFYSFYMLHKFIIDIKSEWPNSKNCFPFIRLHFLKSKEAMEKHWKNTKFIILNYDDKYRKDEFKSLEKDGFIILNLFDIQPDLRINKKFKVSPNDNHPSQYVWTILVPKIADNLNL